MKALTLKQSGQAVVEFVLTLLLVTVVVGAITQFMRQSSGAMWKKLVCDISAPCAGCSASESAKDTAGRLRAGNTVAGFSGVYCK
ncbi:MAG: hypothetical protein KA715_02640 [Xanthomonadaceae bacterium]|nr:hypothetical protein [Xanthomonadaceae bacterium]